MKLLRSLVVNEVEPPLLMFSNDQDITQAQISVKNAPGVHVADGLGKCSYQHPFVLERFGVAAPANVADQLIHWRGVLDLSCYQHIVKIKETKAALE